MHESVKTIVYGCDCSSETHSQQSENYNDKLVYSSRVESFWPLYDNEKVIYTITVAKDTKSLRRNMLTILSFKKFLNLKGRNNMQKKRMQNEGMQI